MTTTHFPKLKDVIHCLGRNDTHTRELDLDCMKLGITEFMTSKSQGGYNNAQQSLDISNFVHHMSVLSAVMNMNTVVDTVHIDFDFISMLNENLRFVVFRAIGNLPLKHLDIFSNLQVRELPLSWITPILHSVANNLSSLGLCNLQLTGSRKELSQFCDALRMSTRLRKFRFINVYFRSKGNGVEELLKKLSSTGAITKIEDIRIVYMGNNTIRKSSFLSLNAIASTCTIQTLKRLSLNGMNLNKDNLSGIVQALRNNNSSLQYLNLSCNNLGDRGCTWLVAALQCNSNLQELYLANNLLQTKSAIAIGDMLQTNTKTQLRCLSLSNNNMISEQGCCAVVQSLFINKSMQKLHLRDCGLGDIGVSVIANVLRSNQSLRELYLKFDINISRIAYQSLVLAMETKNFVLEKLVMETPTVQMPIELAMKLNYYCSLNLDGFRYKLYHNNGQTITSREQWIFYIITFVRNIQNHQATMKKRTSSSTRTSTKLTSNTTTNTSNGCSSFGQIHLDLSKIYCLIRKKSEVLIVPALNNL